MGKFSLKIPFQMFTVAIPQTKYSMNPPVKIPKRDAMRKGVKWRHYHPAGRSD